MYAKTDKICNFKKSGNGRNNFQPEVEIKINFKYRCHKYHNISHKIIHYSDEKVKTVKNAENDAFFYADEACQVSETEISKWFLDSGATLTYIKTVENLTAML